MSNDSPVPGAAAAIAAALLVGEPIPSSDRVALYRRARRLIPAVAASGPLEALVDLGDAAQRDVASPAVPEEVKRSAESLLAALGQRAIAARILDAVQHFDVSRETVERALASTGAAGVWALAERLTDPAAAGVKPRLYELASRLDREAIEEALRDAHASDFAETSRLFPLLASLPQALARRAGYELIGHPDARVRHRVLAFLLTSGDEDAAWQRLVRRALDDDDATVVRMARSALVHANRTHADLIRIALASDGSYPIDARTRRELERRLHEAGARASGRERTA